MTELSITMPADLQRWLDSRIAEGRYVDASDYVRDLIRRDLEQASLWEEDTARVRRLIDEGEASGLSDEDPFELIDRLIAQSRSDG